MKNRSAEKALVITLAVTAGVLAVLGKDGWGLFLFFAIVFAMG